LIFTTDMEDNDSAPLILEIIYEDQWLVAVNKPSGIFVHRTKLDPTAKVFVVQSLRDQIGQHVHPVHRLDRKTSGVLLLGKTKEAHALLSEQFRERNMEKRYHAIVRGYTDDAGLIDYDVTNDNGKLQSAQSAYRCLERVELAVPFGKHPTSRYSLVELDPITGRQHQLRKHMSHIFHPIIGDRPHGCNKQNRFFLEQFDMSEMLLHAKLLRFKHPYSGADILLKASYPPHFLRMLEALSFTRHLEK